jgi:hypothetical protein
MLYFQRPPSVSQKSQETIPLQVAHWGLCGEICLFPKLSVTCLVILNESSPNKNKFHPSLIGARKGVSPMFPKMGLLWKHANFQSLTWHVSHEKLLVSHRVPPQVADRATLTRYGGYRGNKIPGVDQN